MTSLKTMTNIFFAFINISQYLQTQENITDFFTEQVRFLKGIAITKLKLSKLIKSSDLVVRLYNFQCF